MKQEDVTTTVTLLGVVSGDPPGILIGKRLSRAGKQGRLFQQIVPVLDADLFARLTSQVGKGDTITITVTTEWRPDGYRTYLSTFTLPAGAVPVEPKQAQAIK